MKARITLLTLGVDDLEGAVAFFELEGGLRMALWPRRDLAHDTGLKQSRSSSTEFSIGHNVRSEKEVDAVMKQADKAGAKIVKPAVKTFWGGYAGYFADPDGHLWEVAYNPAMLPED